MKKQKTEFSKILLIQESALIWFLSFAFIGLAYYCIHMGYTGSLPWLAAMVGFPWTAYGVSQAMYYRKSEKENTRNGIKFETALTEVKAKYENKIDWNTAETGPQDDAGLDKPTEPPAADIYYGI